MTTEKEKVQRKLMRKTRNELWTFLHNCTDRQDLGQTKKEIVLEILSYTGADKLKNWSKSFKKRRC